jgi:hypothetical protein
MELTHIPASIIWKKNKVKWTQMGGLGILLECLDSHCGHPNLLRGFFVFLPVLLGIEFFSGLHDRIAWECSMCEASLWGCSVAQSGQRWHAVAEDSAKEVPRLLATGVKSLMQNTSSYILSSNWVWRGLIGARYSFQVPAVGVAYKRFMVGSS